MSIDLRDSPFCNSLSQATCGLPDGAELDSLIEIGMLPTSVVLEPPLELWFLISGNSRSELELSESWKDSRTPTPKATPSSWCGLYIKLFILDFSILIYTESFIK